MSSRIYSILRTQPGLLSFVKATVAVLLTVVVSPIIALVHLGIKLFNSKEEKNAAEVAVKPINDGLECFDDLNEQTDLTKETRLSSLAAMHKHLNVRLLVRDKEAHYKELSKGQSVDTKNDKLVLGVYGNDKPCGIIEMNRKNIGGIIALLNRNEHHIAENLEEADAVQSMYYSMS